MMRGTDRNLVYSLSRRLVRRLAKLHPITLRIAREEPFAAIGAGLYGIDVGVAVRDQVAVQRLGLGRFKGHMVQAGDRMLRGQRQHLDELTAR